MGRLRCASSFQGDATGCEPHRRGGARRRGGDGSGEGGDRCPNRLPSFGTVTFMDRSVRPALPRSVATSIESALAEIGAKTADTGKEAEEVAEAEKEHEDLLAKAKKRRQEAAVASDGEPIMKRPAAKGPMKVAMKRPAAASSKPRMPEAGVGVDYRGGKILGSESKQGWRVWPDKGTVGYERLVKYDGGKKASFTKALKAIDDAI